MSETPAIPHRACAGKTDEGEACPHHAKWMPVLLLYPSVLHGPSKPMTMQVDIALCDAHRDNARAKDFATEGLYELAEKACANANVAWPERTLTRLKFLDYRESPLGRMKDRERAEAN